MPTSYRAALASLGVFLALGGAVGVYGALTASGTAVQHLASLIGSAFATVCGVIVVRATITGRVPAWFGKLFGYDPDE